MYGMRMNNSSLYYEDVKKIASAPIDWKCFGDKVILIAGATGMIGCFLIDVLMMKNETDGLDCHIIALGRDIDKAKKRINSNYFNSSLFEFIEHDIKHELPLLSRHIDYIVNLASNTHPVLYATKPIDTILTNVFGTYNLLELSCHNKNSRYCFVSSVEIYGENRGDKERFDELYSGILDSNTLRANYPEAKRLGETLCNAYRNEKKIDYVIVRLPRVFGSTLQEDDTKAISQFIKKARDGEDIVLKSDGSQQYSFLYVADAVSGLLWVISKGGTGEAYNVADEKYDASLKEIAELSASIAGTNIVYAKAEEAENAGYSSATKAKLDGAKIKGLGWKPLYDVEVALQRTITILGEQKEEQEDNE